jgi:hypothetical protein
MPMGPATMSSIDVYFIGTECRGLIIQRDEGKLQTCCLLVHLRKLDTVGLLLLNIINTHQLTAGTKDHLLTVPRRNTSYLTPGWITLLCSFLKEANAAIHIPIATGLTTSRLNDVFLMSMGADV